MLPQPVGGMLMATFRGRLLGLRGRANLSQRELALLLGVSERAVQAWEAGLSYPSATSLQRLIALYVERGAFPAGQEAEAAAALWDAALDEAPRLKVPFDHAWFAALQPSASDARRPAAVTARAPVQRVSGPELGPPREDWGAAPDVSAFYGRAEELATLGHWVLAERC